MYIEILFGLACFGIGLICGIGAIIMLFVKGLKSLTRRKTPKH